MGELSRRSYPCVAPSWPEWAVTEDGDFVWVRADLADRASDVASPTLEHSCHLEARRLEPMWLDRVDTEWSGDWLLRPVEDDADEAALYVKYEVVCVW